MTSKEELLKQMLQEYIRESGSNGDIQLGDFIIRCQEKSSTKTFEKSDSTTVPPQSEEPVPNNFVMDCFLSFDNPSLASLDAFIQQPCHINPLSKVSTESNPSVEISKKDFKRKAVDKHIFSNVYRILDNCNEPLRDKLEDALHEDFEQILKPHFSVSESSNTHLSFDTFTTDNNQQDPLRAFLMTLIPQQPAGHPSPKQQIDFLYLYSQPLVHVHNQQSRVVQLLESQKEKEAIMDVLRTEGGELKFVSMPARVDLFGEALDLSPLVLHYSGHGAHFDQQSFLFFETVSGTVSLMSTHNLSLMLKKLQRKILFVFVASCHSKLIGEVFQQAGAQHVICVNTRERIMDEVCRVFARAFYHALIRGQSTVCEAFQVARDQVKVEGRFPCAEENKFILLRTEPESIFHEHKCTRLNLSQGTFKDLTKVVPHSDSLPGRVPHFTGRQLVMQELVEKILNNKLVCVKGILGVGKSAVLKEVAIYISERLVFKDGVLFMQLGDCDSLDALASVMYLKILPNAAPVQSKSEIKQLIITQLVQTLRNLELLLVLDNCDMVLYSTDREAFLDFLEILLSNCSKLHLCLSTRNEIHIPGSPCKQVRVEGLSSEDSVQLMLGYAQREVSRGEVEELVDHISDQIYGDRVLVQKLAGHPLMATLDGHPQAIILSAGLLERYSLKELYHELTYKQIIEIPVIGSDGYTLEEQQTLRVSMNLSWNSLVDMSEKAAQFFSVMGLLPSGGSQDEFEFMWGQGWEKWKNQLLKSSLLVQHKKLNKTYYSLYPFMTKFAESKLEIKAFRHYHFNTVKYYTNKLQSLYQTIGTQVGESNQHIDIFLMMEPNIRAAIMREFEMSGGLDIDAFMQHDSAASGGKASKPQLKKQRSEQTEEEEDKDVNFTLPLTKENLQIVQQRYESSQKTQKHAHVKFLTNSVYSHQTFKHFDQSSDEPRKSTMTDQAHRRKSMSNYQTHVTISEENVEENEDFDDIDLEQTESQILTVPTNFAMQENPSQVSQFSRVLEPKVQQSDPAQPAPKKSALIEAIGNRSLAAPKKLKFEDDVVEQRKPSQPSQPQVKKEVPAQKSRDTQDGKKKKAQQLIFLECSVLLLIRRYHECLKFINWTLRCMVSDGDGLYRANLMKLKGCVYYMQKEQGKAKQAFKEAEESFIKKGCMLGVGSCEAALGYIYLQDREFQHAKVCFENAIYFYEELNHDFGRHFLNRWLSLVKNKISSLKNDRLRHISEEKQLIESLKQEFKRGIKIDNLIHKKHKGGIFTLRWLGDTISLFVEPAWVLDSKQRTIMNFMKSPVVQKPSANRRNVLVKVMDFDTSSDQAEQPATVPRTHPSSSASSATGKKSVVKKKPVLVENIVALKQKLIQIAEEEVSEEDRSASKQKRKPSLPSAQFKKEKKLLSDNHSEQPLKPTVHKQRTGQKIMPCFKKMQQTQPMKKTNPSD